MNKSVGVFAKMSRYEMKQVHCGNCGYWVGEIEYRCKVEKPRCGVCSNHTTSSIITTSPNTTALTLYKKESGVD